MQTQRPVYEEIEELLVGIEPPPVALVEQRVDGQPALGDIRAAVGEALRSVEIPTGSVAVGVGSRGVGGISDVVAALVGFLKEAGAEPFGGPGEGEPGGLYGRGAGGRPRAPGGERGGGRISDRGARGGGGDGGDG